MKRLALALILPLILLAGCGDDRECLKGHHETQLIPIYNGKTTSIIPTSVWVCDEYALEVAD